VINPNPWKIQADSNASAMTASHATITSAVTAPAVILAFSLSVQLRIVSAKSVDSEAVASANSNHPIAPKK
jgi:hypothetical protein